MTNVCTTTVGSGAKNSIPVWAKLNGMVRGLHETRNSLERSVYQVHGEYAHLRDLPMIEFPVPNAVDLDKAKLDAITALAMNIARQPEGFGDLPTTRWAALKVSASSIGIADQVRLDADKALKIVHHTRLGLEEQANHLGVVPPADLKAADHLQQLILHLCEKPIVLQHWLKPRALPEFRARRPRSNANNKL